MSDKKLSVFRCEECGEYERSEVGPTRWLRDAEDVLTHYHSAGDGSAHARCVPAEEVEVIPVVRAEELEAERDGLAEAAESVLGQRVNLDWPSIHLWRYAGFYDVVEQVSPGPYLEMFSRRERLGWDSWGDQSANSSGLELASAETAGAE